MKIEKNLSPLIVSEESSLRNVMERLNQSPYLVQMVTDKNNVLVGTATDGDLRRGLLEGCQLADPVSKCMHRNPLVGKTTEEASRLLIENVNHFRFVPVIDEEGRPLHILFNAPDELVVDTALIMVGGYGKRLGELTIKTPKPLLAVGGEPILSHLLRELEAISLSKIYLAAHYLSDQIEDFVARSPWADKTEVIIENQPMGTAGILGELKSKLVGPLLMLNGDLLTRTDYSAMILHHQSSRWDLTVGGAAYVDEVPYGVIEHDDKGLISAIIEKPRTDHLVAAGIYMMEPEIYNLVEKNSSFDMPQLIQKGIDSNHNVGVFPIHEYWSDLGVPSRLKTASQDIKEWQ
jgi:dTDP-glucose pyrophosphorylase